MPHSVRERIERQVVTLVGTQVDGDDPAMTAQRLNMLDGNTTTDAGGTTIAVVEGGTETLDRETEGANGQNTYTLELFVSAEIVQAPGDTIGSMERFNAFRTAIIRNVLSNPKLVDSFGERLAIDTRHVRTEGPFFTDQSEGLFMVSVVFEIDYRATADNPCTAPGVTERTL